MRKVDVSEVKDLTAYERVREPIRARNIEHTRQRRIAVGENLTFLFENRETVLFQIQEMVRTERIVDEARIREEVDAYNALIPGPNELSATLFIEIPDLVRMSPAQVREAVNRFQGLDRDGVIWLRIGADVALPARFEEGHSKEEKMSAVHYLRFAVPAQSRAALSDPSRPATLVVNHPNYKAEAPIPDALRAELLKDLAEQQAPAGWSAM
jgi:uncharacterized protein DUF3501